MNKPFLIFLLLIASTRMLLAQNEADRRAIISQTNVEKLQQLAEQYEAAYAKVLKDRSIQQEVTYKNGQIGRLVGVDRNGTLMYAMDDNEAAAASSRINRIQVGGTTGFDLDGEGVEVGVWESGLALRSHQELTGRVVHAEFAPASGHATHTGATIAGTGVRSGAQGMAPAATLLSHTSANDEPEMINFAIAGGILSNHSYSSGNPNEFDAGYGVYTPYAAEWDEILFNAPYFTVVKSASNSRNDGVNVNDGGYDIIFGSGGSKNTLTIGAVDDVVQYAGPFSVNQSAFSNWGPTDDWRIKPDITANGVSVWSGDVDNDTDYRFRSGTSMSAAVVSGTIALLQQFYHRLNGVYLKAASVKALLVGTTDEVGDHDGPDFQSGWGLLNAQRAAEVILQDGITSSIDELSIKNDETYTREIEVGDNTSLELTIAWTDVPGNPLINGGLDNASSMLINDLDVKIVGDDETYLPWTFSPDSTFTNFTAAPMKGNNGRDNVERIDVRRLDAGTYTIEVSHKGTLVNGFQDFSMVINGLKESSLALTDPLNETPNFTVYPIPARNGQLSLNLSDPFYAGPYTLQISSIDGQLLSSQKYNQQRLQLDVSTLAAGAYFISIQTKNAQQSKRIIILEE